MNDIATHTGWQEKFKESTTGVGFLLSLSKPQMNLLIHMKKPSQDIFEYPSIATYHALLRKGLIESDGGSQWNSYQLSLAGYKVLDLLELL